MKLRVSRAQQHQTGLRAEVQPLLAAMRLPFSGRREFRSRAPQRLGQAGNLAFPSGHQEPQGGQGRRLVHRGGEAHSRGVKPPLVTSGEVAHGAGTRSGRGASLGDGGRRHRCGVLGGSPPPHPSTGMWSRVWSGWLWCPWNQGGRGGAKGSKGGAQRGRSPDEALPTVVWGFQTRQCAGSTQHPVCLGHVHRKQPQHRASVPSKPGAATAAATRRSEAGAEGMGDALACGGPRVST